MSYDEEEILKKRIIFASVLCLAVWLIMGSIAYGATIFTKSLNASVRVVSNADFSFYSDAAATQPIASINLPDVTPGSTSTFTVYVKNISSADEILASGASTLPSSVGTLSLTFDGQNQKTLAANAVSRLVGTLNAPISAAAGTVNFTVAINASAATVQVNTTTTSTTATAATTLTTTPTSTASNVSYASVIQPIFNQLCITCHGSSGGVTLSSYAATLSSGTVVAGNAVNSRLYQSVASGTMTRYVSSAAQIQSIADWINQGALNN